MQQQFTDINLNTFYLYKETLAEGERQYKQGQINQLNSLIEALEQQQKEGYKFAQIFKMLNEQDLNKDFTARILGNNFDNNKKLISNGKDFSVVSTIDNYFSYQQLFINIIQYQIKMNTKSSIPTFILKTYQMLEDQKNTNVISWTSQGTAFIVYNQILLEKEVLQNFFKHSNYSSFVRQLNLYNFKKVKSNEGQIFKHKCFRKGMKSMLSFIKRKNQDDSVGGSNTLVQEEPTIHIKEEQNLFKECAIDIKETNNKLKEDMKLLQETSSYLIDQMQNLNHFVYNQSVDIEVKFKQVGQMLHAINEELRQENKSETITNKFMDKKEESFQESKVGSPNPYVDYNSIALNPLDYEYFIDSFL